MGQLVLVFNRVNTLAGPIALVTELVEKLKELRIPQGNLESFRRLQERVAYQQKTVVGNGRLVSETFPAFPDNFPKENEWKVD